MNLETLTIHATTINGAAYRKSGLEAPFWLHLMYRTTGSFDIATVAEIAPLQPQRRANLSTCSLSRRSCLLLLPRESAMPDTKEAGSVAQSKVRCASNGPWLAYVSIITSLAMSRGGPDNSGSFGVMLALQTAALIGAKKDRIRLPAHACMSLVVLVGLSLILSIPQAPSKHSDQGSSFRSIRRSCQTIWEKLP
ncbi:unnamed protein product [Symbiodinium natans]|uniref:Uncharacterized protein n=1 Tax=Symbiodinium natans TaxID=878477 RepID=A0A812T131_9DINO|nr:unnamed protein product [Symbiodinium natans]